jgi:hypothetical protein
MQKYVQTQYLLANFKLDDLSNWVTYYIIIFRVLKFSIKLMINSMEDLNGFIMKPLNVLNLLYVDSWIIVDQIFSGNCFPIYFYHAFTKGPSKAFSFHVRSSKHVHPHIFLL